MLKLIPPGRRKDNRFYIARGTIDGQPVEFSTRETDKGRAEAAAARLLPTFLNRRVTAEPQEVKTFRQAAEAYTAWRTPGWDEIRRINRLIADLGDRDIRTMTSSDLIGAAGRICPDHKASSRNRLVITPASAILHYAAEQGWCPWVRCRRFKEAKPETRAIRADAARKLVRSAKGIERAFLIFLFGQGMRVSDAIAVSWERINLRDGLIQVKIAKTDQWRWKAMDPDARAALASLPLPKGERKRSGPVFPWKNRWAVYRALAAAVEASGIAFTPHMARHSLGTWLAAAGVSLKTRMDIMDHADPKSNVRYEMSQIPEQQAALQARADLAGLAPRKGKKRFPAKKTA
jgi:integrase